MGSLFRFHGGDRQRGPGPAVGGRTALVAAVVVFAAGCHLTHRATTVQPNPLRHPSETLRESMPITIITGDMELNLPRVSASPGGDLLVNERYPLRNIATFTVVSRDRLRFHVQLEHKWREWADPTTWHAYLVVDRGHRYRPEETDLISDRMLVTMWDRQKRTALRDRFGDPVYVLNDGYKRRQTLGSLAVFRGRGDFVFYARDLFTSKVKSLTLVLRRARLGFSFTWKFQDDQIGGVQSVQATAVRLRGRALQALQDRSQQSRRQPLPM